jgi:hypothetical protein
MKREDIEKAWKLKQALSDAENRRSQVDVESKTVNIEYGGGKASYGSCSLLPDGPEALAIMAIVKSHLDRRVKALEQKIEAL